MITLNTECIYLVTDGQNGHVHLLTPKGLKLEVIVLQIDDQDPNSNDKDEYRILRNVMEETTADL